MDVDQVNQLKERARRLVRRRLDRIRWGGAIRTILQGPAAGLLIHTRDASDEYAEGLNEIPVQTTLQGLLQPGDTFFDIGANVGFFTLLAARAVGPSGSVVSFEPVRQIAATLAQNVKLNDFSNVEVIEVAVGARTGRAALRLTSHPGGATISPDAVVPDQTSVVETEVVCIDALVSIGRVPSPNLVKIDVEGHELDCLTGMSDLLQFHRPTLLIELDAATTAALASKRNAVGEFLDRRGYQIEMLPDAYPGTAWCVAHLLATAS